MLYNKKMGHRERALEALRGAGIERPTMRMVHRLTRKERQVVSIGEAYNVWTWKYHEPVLFEALAQAVRELGPNYRAVRLAERAFHGAKSCKQVFANLDSLLREEQSEAA